MSNDQPSATEAAVHEAASLTAPSQDQASAGATLLAEADNSSERVSTTDASEISIASLLAERGVAKVKAAHSKWHDFLFGDAPGAVFTLWRVCLGWVVFYWLFTLWPDLNWFFGDNTVDPVPYYGSTTWGFFRWLDAEQWFGPLWILAMVASVGVMTGKFVRISGIFMAVSVISFIAENNVIWNAGDVLVRINCVIFAFACIVMPTDALSTPVFGMRQADGSRHWNPVPGWALRLLQIQLSVIYLNTVIEKIPGEPWRDGTAAGMALKLQTMERLPVPEFMTENLFIVNGLTWITLGLEITLPFLLWNKRTRRAAIIAGLLMHFFFDVGLYIGAFSWAMYLCYLAFFPQEWSERILTAGADLADRMIAPFRSADSATTPAAMVPAEVSVS